MFKSPKVQRLIASSITALLAANAMVLVTGILGSEDNTKAPAETVTYIQNVDGTQTLVDPTTPEGWQAIQDAEQRGDEILTVPAADAPDAVQAQRVTTSTTSTTKPKPKPATATNGAGSGVTIPDVNGVVNTVVSTVNSVVDTANETVGTVTSVVEDTTGVDVPTVTVPHVTVPPTTTPPTTVPPTTAPPVTTPPVTVPPALPGGGSTVVTSVTVPTTLPPVGL